MSNSLQYELNIVWDNIDQRCITKPDLQAQSLLPDPFKHLIPNACKGDGNCLYRSGSIIAFGNENNHVEMRVRTIIEMYLYEKHLNCSKFDDTAIKHLFVGLLALKSMEWSKIDDETVRTVFELEVTEAVNLCSYSSLWHMQGMCSIIQAA